MLIFMHNILNLCETNVYYASIKEKQWHQPLVKYQIAHNRYSSKKIVTLNQNQIANTIFQLLSCGDYELWQWWVEGFMGRWFGSN